MKTKKITRLTPAQEARFPEFVAKWTKIGLETAPADRPRAEKAIKEMYVTAALDSPRIMWCGSPLGNILARKIVASVDSVVDRVRASVADGVAARVTPGVRASVADGVRDSVWVSVADRVHDRVAARVTPGVRASVADGVSASIVANIRASVPDGVWDSVWGSVAARVTPGIRASVADGVADSIRASVPDGVVGSIWGSVAGQHESAWLSFYDFFATVCNLVDETSQLHGLFELSQSAGWALPCKGICWVSERHNVLHCDDRGRIHSTTGPAIAYPDGWEIYAVHGTRIPPEWIRDKALTPPIAFAEGNVERRRAAFELLGWDRVIAELDARVIDCNPDPMIGTLVEINHPSIGQERFLRVRCGTGRDFVLPVPHEMSTALAANAWTYGLDAAEYNPEVRT